jgi:hypothetical protein
MLAKPSPLYDSLSGRIGNIVNKSFSNQLVVAKYFKTKNFTTTPASLHKSIYSSLCQTWQAYTWADRATWNSLALDFPFTNKFGGIYYLSGFKLFLYYNFPITRAGQPAMPKVVLQTPYIESGEYSISSPSLNIRNNNPVNPFDFFDFYAMLPQSYPWPLNIKQYTWLATAHVDQFAYFDLGPSILARLNPQSIAYYSAPFAVIGRNYLTGHKSAILHESFGVVA